MAEEKIALGDDVGVPFHPPGAMRSYSEGVVRRVDVTTPEGHVFVVEVLHQGSLVREHRIRCGFPDYVRYECRNDFPGRIKVLSVAPGTEQAPALDLTLMEPQEETKQEANELPPVAASNRA
jgi:hypothetical protein